MVPLNFISKYKTLDKVRQADSMQARNTVRNILNRENISVNENTAIVFLLNKFIPGKFSSLTLKTDYRCTTGCDNMLIEKQRISQSVELINACTSVQSSLDESVKSHSAAVAKQQHKQKKKINANREQCGRNDAEPSHVFLVGKAPPVLIMDCTAIREQLKTGTNMKVDWLITFGGKYKHAVTVMCNSGIRHS